MKKIIVIILCLMLASCPALAASPSTDEIQKPAGVDFKDYNIEDYTIQVPDNWTFDIYENNGIEYHRFFLHPITDRFGGFLYMYIFGFGYSIDLNILGDSAYDYYFLTLNATNIRRETITVFNKPAVIWRGNLLFDDGVTRPVCSFICIDNDLCFNLIYVNTNETYDTNMDFVRYVAHTFRRKTSDDNTNDNADVDENPGFKNAVDAFHDFVNGKKSSE